ncbi:MAG: thiamine-phosphate kinase [Rikenellaceae bacterium]|nr:thiamine-phosphate kinase [Rikenellaceae bacterium]
MPLQGEFEWIARIRAMFAPLAAGRGRTGIGDDAAVLPQGGGRSLVVTTDMLVEGRHFLHEKITPEELGRKSLAVNLSDIAAMGARPIASFLSVALSSLADDAFFGGFMQGYAEMSERYGVPLLGGDTTASSTGVVVNVALLGEADDTHIKYRSTARPGDAVIVTGPLGDSAAGLKLLLSGDTAENLTAEEITLVKTHHNPRPHVEEGLFLGAERDVHAMMDVSDGVASDLRHILRASGVAAEVFMDKTPLSSRLQELCTRRGWDARELAFAGGEDYVLLATVAPEALDDIQKRYAEKFNEKLFVIGRIASGSPRIAWTEQGVPRPLDYHGFTHF